MDASEDHGQPAYLVASPRRALGRSRAVRQLLSWSLFLVIIWLAFLTAGPTVLGGPASYVIVDGRSMEPTYEHGDLVVAYERDTYAAGDVVVYDAPVDHQFTVIHRVVEATDGGYITQGDNRDEVDGWIAPTREIHGAALFHVPAGGTVLQFLRQPAAIAGLLAGFLVLGYYSHLEKRQREGVAAETSTTDEQKVETLR